jgi:hypothetical protein
MTQEDRRPKNRRREELAAELNIGRRRPGRAKPAVGADPHAFADKKQV